MIKVTMEIDGMACGMCEAHMKDAIRKDFNVKKLTASHKSGLVEFVSDNEIDEDKLKKNIGNTGYRMVSFKSEQYVKKGLFSK